MPIALITGTVVTVLVAAVRSTWSPCGWSMLSTITPLTERGRGHRFGVTASWFIGGATLGGTLLGGLAALGALGVDAIGLSGSGRVGVAGAAALAAAALDSGRIAPPLPHHRRQVNEDWLDEFRPWVYAAGFGLQIGSGLTTYIMTGAVYLVVVLGALTAAWPVALLVGTGFGFLRGLAVLSGAGNTDPQRLAAFHRRFAALDAPVRRAVAVVLASVGGALSAVAFGVPDVVGVAVPTVTVALAAVGTLRSGGYGRSTVILPNAPLSSATDPARRTSDPTTA